MKYVLLAMGIMSFILIGGAGTISIILTKILGGGIEESFIYPIYGGLIVLSGMVAVVIMKPPFVYRETDYMVFNS